MLATETTKVLTNIQVEDMCASWQFIQWEILLKTSVIHKMALEEREP